MAAEIRTAKSARHGSRVITIHFPRFVFLACGSSQNARAGTHRGMLARTVVMEQVTEMHKPFPRKLLTSDKRCRAELKLVINVAEERVDITIQKEK
jgi:hypothetical protein